MMRGMMFPVQAEARIASMRLGLVRWPRRDSHLTLPYTHYSYLHTVEDNWGLPTLTSDDAGAPVMSEFFTGFSGSGIPGVFQYWPVILILVAVVVAAVLISVKIMPASKRRRQRS